MKSAGLIGIPAVLVLAVGCGHAGLGRGSSPGASQPALVTTATAPASAGAAGADNLAQDEQQLTAAGSDLSGIDQQMPQLRNDISTQEGT